MEDKHIIELFYGRSEQALTELDLKYGKLCHQLSYHILYSWEDAGECVNDSYLAAWNTIPPAMPDPLRAYLCKIVRNLSLKLYYHQTAARRNSHYDMAMDELEHTLSSPDTVESQLEAKELAGILQSFLDSLTEENAVIFLRRYWFCDSYEAIARRVGLTEKNISVRLVRIRKQLKKYLREREVFL